MNKFLQIAINEAKKAVVKKTGGPFGAVIVCKGKIIAKAHNTVIKDNDSTAHAEINAIRKASKKLKNYDLSGCELYVTCEPCPMCYSAIHWSRIKKIYFGASSKDASKIGFDDKALYQILNGKKKAIVKKQKLSDDGCIALMKKYAKSVHKKY